jgi:hypothetical protein
LRQRVGTTVIRAASHFLAAESTDRKPEKRPTILRGRVSRKRHFRASQSHFLAFMPRGVIRSARHLGTFVNSKFLVMVT